MRSSKRRRRKPSVLLHSTQVSTVEERLLNQAIQNSKLDTRRPVDGRLEIPDGPTFFPTVEEFEGNPLHYIEKIRPAAQKYGIAKIVPPRGWNPPFCVDMNSTKRFSTKEQLLHRLQEGISFGDGEEYTVAEYQSVASHKSKEWKAKYYPDHDVLKNIRDYSSSDEKKQDAESKLMTPENLEREYWDIVETHTRELAVEYGNDVETSRYGSGFPLSERGRAIAGKPDPEKMKQSEPKFGEPDFYKETWWNLNNIPQAPDSVLRHVRVGINGVNVPWMYYGTLFSTFCWHNEDNYLYSINYHHKGAPKRWYGVPGTRKDSDGVEKVFKSYLSMKLRDVPDLLHHITTMFSPRLLQNADVPVYKLMQYPGEFVVTFPRSFHGGFSLGPNAGEAVNFATHDWIAHGADANERYRSYARPAVFSHDRLTFTMANHLNEQKTYATCHLLLAELERVVAEELELREKLISEGIRDVSHMITLPRNRLDQLDEESADYDDKRLCHACKHVCFFSAVACECSQTKVSCLRHSHYMCRCTPERKYLMIWSGEKEMNGTLKKVRDYCSSLQKVESDQESDRAASNSEAAEVVEGVAQPKESDRATEAGESTEDVEDAAEKVPSLAPGVEKDREAHKNDELTLEPVGADPDFEPVACESVVPMAKRAKLSMGGTPAVVTSGDEMPPDDSIRRQASSGMDSTGENNALKGNEGQLVPKLEAEVKVLPSDV